MYTVGGLCTIIGDDRDGLSKDNPPDIQVRGVTYGTAERRTITGLSQVIILFDIHQIIPQINKIIIRLSYTKCETGMLHIITAASRIIPLALDPKPAAVLPCTLGC